MDLEIFIVVQSIKLNPLPDLLLLAIFNYINLFQFCLKVIHVFEFWFDTLDNDKDL